MNGHLIAFEGIQGAGKTTLVNRITERLRESGIATKKIETVEEENKDFLEEFIDRFSLEPLTPAFMFLYQSLHARKAARANEAVEDGNIVVSDRWDLSYFVSHNNFGFMSDEPEHVRKEVSRLAFRGLNPDLGVYLDVEIEQAIRRRKSRGERIDDTRAEKQHCKEVKAGYERLIKNRDWIVVDANKNIEEVEERVFNLLFDVL